MVTSEDMEGDRDSILAQYVIGKISSAALDEVQFQAAAYRILRILDIDPTSFGYRPHIYGPRSDLMDAKRREMEARLSRLLGRRYSKGEDLTRAITDGRIRDAIDRAERRLPRDSCTLEECFRREPSTMLHVLVSDLLEMSEAVRRNPSSRTR